MKAFNEWKEEYCRKNPEALSLSQNELKVMWDNYVMKALRSAPPPVAMKEEERQAKLLKMMAEEQGNLFSEKEAGNKKTMEQEPLTGNDNVKIDVASINERSAKNTKSLERKLDLSTESLERKLDKLYDVMNHIRWIMIGFVMITIVIPALLYNLLK